MSDKLTWEEIKRRYDRQWIELVDYDWPDTEPYPEAGVVRLNAKSRAEFHEEIAKLPPADSAILYVGKADVPPGTVFNVGLRRVVDA